MSRRSRIYSVVFPAIVAGSWSPARLCAGEGGPARPFRGTAVGGITGVVPPNEIVVESTGTATHLGRFTREEHLFLDPDGISFTGTIVFTAASGDELWLTLDGQFTSPTTAIGSYEITGGTGRFRDAAGAASFVAVLGDGGRVEVVFDGSIRY